MNNVLDVCQVSIKRGRFCLWDISFSVKKGYITGLVGRIGSGKTTLLKAICNATEIKKGTIKVFGRDSIREDVLNKQELGIVMDDLTYFENDLSIWENAQLLASLYRDWDDDILYYYLKKYGIITGMEEDSEKYGDAKRSLINRPREELVKVRLAFALAHKPRLLLLDEPSADLDPVFRREFLAELQELRDCPYWLRDADEKEREEQAMAIILCTHTTSEIDQVGDHILLLDKGHLIADGNREELFEKHEVSNTKELVLKLTEKEDGYIFPERELQKKRPRYKQPERGKDRFRLDRYAVPSNNIDGLRQCEEYIYKYAKTGRIFTGWTFLLYLFLTGVSISLYMRYLYFENIFTVFLTSILIAIINMQYFSHYTYNLGDHLNEAMPYLPFNIQDMKVCLKEQRNRLLLFWLAVQSVLALLVGLFGIIREETLPLAWMAWMVLGSIIITLYSAHCQMWMLKNQQKYFYHEMSIFCVILLFGWIFYETWFGLPHV